jgi:predicted PurR-regulated permease PerM
VSNSPNPKRLLHASIKAGSLAQIVVAVIAVLGLIYLLKVVLVTTLTAMLLAFALEPLVKQLCRIRIPRALGALLAVLLYAGANRHPPLWVLQLKFRH